MSRKTEEKIYLQFIVSVGLTFVVSLSIIFVAVSISTRNLISAQALAQARAHFNSIVMTRKWNANYGGVYVERKEGMTSNPYLKNPDIRTTDGRVFTKINPALMTREISGYAEKEGLVRFHITSLNVLNPANKPDEFEAEALRLFENGTTEHFSQVRKNNAAYFRYMAPLHVEKVCLECHYDQGYRVGDIRGGISVMFDMDHIQAIKKTSTIITVSLAFLSISLILGLSGFFTLRLVRRVSVARKRIEEMAITDGLTNVYNRRHVIERLEEEVARARRLNRKLGCIMLDVDNFKSINDRFGHLTGDEVLKETAHTVRNALRSYDIVGRYGGEEFLIILPDTDPDAAFALAERLRQNVRSVGKSNDLLPPDTIVTISLGVACLTDSDSSIDDLLIRTDNNLYKAKISGRDRTVSDFSGH